MLITEKDLFLYVLKSDNLDKEKLIFIENRLEEFKDKINLISQLIDPKLKNLNHIPHQEKSNLFILYPKEKKVIRSNSFVLAAKSEINLQKRLVFTYTNEDYIFKILNKDEKYLAFLFSSNGEEIKKYKIALYPFIKNLINIEELSLDNIDFDKITKIKIELL